MHYLHENKATGNVIRQTDDRVYGVSIKELLSDSPLPISISIEILAYVADILTETDKQNLYHGNISPESVGLTEKGGVFVHDYDPSTTQTTIAPENEIFGIASDTYAMGRLLISLLAGHNNFDIPSDESAHDEQIARIILSLDWQDLSEQAWLENIQDFLVDTLSFHHSERPHPLDVANVLFELLPFTSGETLKDFASRSLSNKQRSAPEEVKDLEAPPQWGQAVAIDTPILKSVTIVPDSSQGAATGLWSRQKIANMFNNDLKDEDKGRREVWKPKGFGHEALPQEVDIQPPPRSIPTPLPSLPDLPPISQYTEPSPTDDPNFFLNAQNNEGSVDNSSNFINETFHNEPDNEPFPMKVEGLGGAGQNASHSHPETAPISSLEDTIPKYPNHRGRLPTTNTSQQSQLSNNSIDRPVMSIHSPQPPSKKWLVLGGLILFLVFILALVGTAYRTYTGNQSDTNTPPLEEITPNPLPSNDPTVETNATDTLEVEEEVEEAEEVEEEKPKPKPKPKPPPISQPTPAPPPTPTPVPTPAPTPQEPEPSPPSETTPAEPVIGNGVIRATISGFNGKLSCGDGQTAEVQNSITLEFTSQQVCRIDADGKRGVVVIGDSKTYVCSINNGAIQCQ